MSGDVRVIPEAQGKRFPWDETNIGASAANLCLSVPRSIKRIASMWSPPSATETLDGESYGFGSMNSQSTTLMLLE